MQDNGTVQQLSKALNQLLDAYEKLQDESVIIKEENRKLKEEVGDLELRNRGLDSRLCALNDTSKQNSSEMDTMLGRIETILGPTITREDESKEEIEEEEEVAAPESETLSMEETEENHKDDNKEIDLGRMQSLLNGFSN